MQAGRGLQPYFMLQNELLRLLRLLRLHWIAFFLPRPLGEGGGEGCTLPISCALIERTGTLTLTLSRQRERGSNRDKAHKKQNSLGRIFSFLQPLG